MVIRRRPAPPWRALARRADRRAFISSYVKYLWLIWNKNEYLIHYLISLISSTSQSIDDMRGEGQYLKCIIQTKLRAVRLQTWPRAFNFIVGFVFQIFLFQIFGFQICRFTFKYWVCPTCLSLANFHQAFPPNRIITKRTDCRELGSENENISVKKCQASGSGIFHNRPLN